VPVERNPAIPEANMAAEGLVHWDQVGLCEVGMSQLPRKIEIFNTCLKITCGVLRMLLGHGAVQSGPSLGARNSAIQGNALFCLLSQLRT
jgi:hypothetical protein